MMKNLVIIPTFNERENVETVIRRVFSLARPFDVLIVDDSSPDGTADIVRGLQKEFSGLGDADRRLHLLSREKKNGLGSAYIAGFRWALERDYELIFEMDADLSHNPDDLPRLADAALTGADVVVGSRYSMGVNVVNWPMGRLLMSWFASKYVRVATGMPVCDATAGFVCWRRKVLTIIDLDRVRMRGYGFQIEMKYTAWRLGFRLAEVSIIFVDRTLGTSKMSSGIFSEAFWGVMGLRFRRPEASEQLRIATRQSREANYEFSTSPEQSSLLELPRRGRKSRNELR